MRRRDLIWAVGLWGAFLAALVWALATQFRWVQEGARPLPAPREKADEPAPPPAPGGTGVIGPIDDATRRALAEGLAPKRPGPPPKPGAEPGPKPGAKPGPAPRSGS